MSYELRTTPRFERLFKQLPREIQIQVTGPISRLSADPYRGKLLHGRLKGKLSLAIGDYRVVYEVETTTVYLLAVRPSKEDLSAIRTLKPLFGEESFSKEILNEWT